MYVFSKKGGNYGRQKETAALSDKDFWRQPVASTTGARVARGQQHKVHTAQRNNVGGNIALRNSWRRGVGTYRREREGCRNESIGEGVRFIGTLQLTPVQ